MTGMLKDIAWNGIHLGVPSTWEIGRVDTRYLFFETQTEPAMEIKWGPVKGHFSHRTHLKKLIAQQKHHPDRHLEAWQLPTPWENALSNFIPKGFSWTSDTQNGHGAILYCPACKNAIMFQFFNHADVVSDKTILKILNSLQDHRKDDQTAWTLFDIHALLPKTFELNHYRFKPGNFELIFSNKFQIVKLFRWAPASSFLAQINLLQFAAEVLKLNQENLVTRSVLGQTAVEWRSNAMVGWRKRFYRFKTKPVFHWARIWHVAGKNRILGICLDSKKPFAANMATDICSNYMVKSSPKSGFQRRGPGGK